MHPRLVAAKRQAFCIHTIANVLPGPQGGKYPVIEEVVEKWVTEWQDKSCEDTQVKACSVVNELNTARSEFEA